MVKWVSENLNATKVGKRSICKNDRNSQDRGDMTTRQPKQPNKARSERITEAQLTRLRA